MNSAASRVASGGVLAMTTEKERFLKVERKWRKGNY